MNRFDYLTDRKSRSVAEGTYLVKGTLYTKSGEKQRVSLVIGVRREAFYLYEFWNTLQKPYDSVRFLDCTPKNIVFC